MTLEQYYDWLCGQFAVIPIGICWSRFVQRFMNQYPLYAIPAAAIKEYANSLYDLVCQQHPRVVSVFDSFLPDPFVSSTHEWLGGHSSFRVTRYGEKDVELHIQCGVSPPNTQTREKHYTYYDLTLIYIKRQHSESVVFHIDVSRLALLDYPALSSEITMLGYYTCLTMKLTWNSFRFLVEEKKVWLSLSSDNTLYTTLDLQSFIDHYSAITSKQWYLKRDQFSNRVYACSYVLPDDVTGKDLTTRVCFPLHTVLLCLNFIDRGRCLIEHKDRNTLNNSISNLMQIPISPSHPRFSSYRISFHDIKHKGGKLFRYFIYRTHDEHQMRWNSNTDIHTQYGQFLYKLPIHRDQTNNVIRPIHTTQTEAAIIHPSYLL